MTLLIIYGLLALTISFVCSMLEAVILSVTPSYIGLALKSGKKYGKILENLKDQIDRPLAAILTLNTVSHTVGAAGVGAQVYNIWGDGYTAVASAVLTILILIIAEIIPKILGVSNWKLLAPFCAYLIRVLIFLMYPFVVFSEFLYKILARGEENTLTREEMIVAAEMGALDGVIRKKESNVIKNLLMLDAIKVADIMTPRSVISALEEDNTVGTVMEKHRPIRFSRLPVYKDDLDHVLGMVHRYKILDTYSQDQENLMVKELITPLHSIPENISVAAALDQFIKRKEHIFLVVDEYGSTVGLVSLEDAIETLLGVEIVDEFDSVADMRQYAVEQWRERKQRQGTGE
jgi:CBS domain containing-hemolysin-like protein